MKIASAIRAYTIYPAHASANASFNNSGMLGERRTPPRNAMPALAFDEILTRVAARM